MICIGSQQEFRLKKKIKERGVLRWQYQCVSHGGLLSAQKGISGYVRQESPAEKSQLWIVLQLNCCIPHENWSSPNTKCNCRALTRHENEKRKLYCKQAVNKEKIYLLQVNVESGSHPDTINSTYLKDNIMLFLDIPVGWVFSKVKRVGGLLTLGRLQTGFTEMLATS